VRQDLFFEHTYQWISIGAPAPTRDSEEPPTMDCTDFDADNPFASAPHLACAVERDRT